MTIDEAIAKYKEIANTDASCPRYCMCTCDKCVHESEQLAEWLEDYKRIKILIPIEQALKNEYNKAIDDFTEKLNAICDGIIKIKWNSTVAPISWAEAYADFKDDIDLIAEQLKAGGSNGT